MELNPLRIVYMGTPEFAIAPLEALVDGGYDIAAVITAPDKPAGRGRKVQQSAVKTYTEEHLNCPILQPNNLKDPAFIKEVQSLGANLFVVVAFRMLPEAIWSIPGHGTFNLHASLLPQYRGAAPINHAIINGETETGVTTFLIDEKIDTGRILLQEKVEIDPADSAGSLHDKLMLSGADLVVQTVRAIENNTLEAVPQDEYKIPEDELRKAPKIFKEDCKVSWNDISANIYNKIRGLSPFPAATSELKKEGFDAVNCKIYSSSISEEIVGSPGSIKSDNKNYILVASSDGSISIKELQIAGKKRMDIKDFLRGFQEDIELYRFT